MHVFASVVGNVSLHIIVGRKKAGPCKILALHLLAVRVHWFPGQEVFHFGSPSFLHRTPSPGGFLSDKPPAVKFSVLLTEDSRDVRFERVELSRL